MIALFLFTSCFFSSSIFTFCLFFICYLFVCLLTCFGTVGRVAAVELLGRLNNWSTVLEDAIASENDKKMTTCSMWDVHEELTAQYVVCPLMIDCVPKLIERPSSTPTTSITQLFAIFYTRFSPRTSDKPFWHLFFWSPKRNRTFFCLCPTVKNLWGLKASWNGQIWPPHFCIICFRTFLDVCSTNDWICVFTKKFRSFDPDPPTV